MKMRGTGYGRGGHSEGECIFYHSHGVIYDLSMVVDTLVLSINRLLPEPHASLLSGMLFGVRASMSPAFYDALIATGTLHVIALSGMNVSIIIRLIFDSMSVFLGKVVGTMFTIVSISAFVLLVGPSPTIVRASLMGSFTVIAALLGRRDIPLVSLLISAFIMILFNRGVIQSVSFQLSFLATWGIIFFSCQGVWSRVVGRIMSKGTRSSVSYAHHQSAFKRIIRLFWAFVRNDLRVTLSAQAFTLPLIFYYFHRVSLISPVANILVGWLVPPITIIGFVTVALALLWQPLGRMMALIVWVPLALFVTLVDLLARVPFASLEF